MSVGRADALRPGHRLHVYTLGDVLGAGGFGITYRAEEEFTHRTVAIKEFLPNLFALRGADGVAVRPISEGARDDFAWGLERFRREARTLYELRHPNIVPVLQYFEANGTGYLVMEYQAGASLGSILKPDKVLDRAELEEILDPLLAGLAAIHAKSFLHRDVKPDNIFIRNDGSPLLLDFGAARQALSARSQSLTTIISEGYAPFEQYESSGNQGPWTDIYALGATLYRCMTGEKPPPAPARVMAHMQGARDPLQPLGPAVRRTYGAALADAAEAALRVSASARPQSVGAFRALIGGAAVPSRAAAETIVPAEPLGTLALGATAAPTPPEEFRPAAPARPRGRLWYWLALANAIAGLAVILFGLATALVQFPQDAWTILAHLAAVAGVLGVPLWFALNKRFFFYVCLAAGAVVAAGVFVFIIATVRVHALLEYSAVAYLTGLGISGLGAVPLWSGAARSYARARSRRRFTESSARAR